jgi:DNA gyrase subunit A
VAEIRAMGRATQGVTLIAVDDGNTLSGVQRVVESDASADASADATDEPKETPE